MTIDYRELCRVIHKGAMEYTRAENTLLARLLALNEARQHDRMYQAMMNNLWGNNPGELERWADDGGREP